MPSAAQDSGRFDQPVEALLITQAADRQYANGLPPAAPRRLRARRISLRSPALRQLDAVRNDAEPVLCNIS